ncbi:hypothetical protein DXG01_015032 [Tephrocybe rancida]|nr:hypothetical protein DXG01_015032 [Tephrocybe rancida]
MSIEPVESADLFLGDFNLSVLTYAAVQQSHDHGTPQAADRAAELCNSFLAVSLDPTRSHHLLDYCSEHLQALIDTMQNLLDDGHVERKLRMVFIRVLAKLSCQSHLYPRRFLLQNVIDQGVKVAWNTTKGSMEGKAVYIEKMSASYDLKDIPRETMLWAQLSHESVLPFYGLCKIGDDPHPSIVSPSRENGNIVDFLERNPDSDRRSFVCDIAAGMSYLHNNGLIHGSIHLQYILVTSAVPHRACLAYCSPSLRDTLRAHNVQDTVSETDGLDEIDFEPDVRDFPYAALEIITHEIDSDNDYDEFSILDGQCPIGHLYDGLDESMWGLLKECYVGSDNRPTARQIVERLKDGKEQWEMSLAAQKHETDSIVKSAITYVSLKQKSDQTTQAHDAGQASTLYDSFRNMLRDLRRYEYLINCRGEGVQALIDSIQSVCDVAAGMSYLHDEGLILGDLDLHGIGVTSAVPPRACITVCEDMQFEPARLLPEEFWPDDAKKKFLEIPLWRTYDPQLVQADDVYQFSPIAFTIFTGCEYGSEHTRLWEDQQCLGMPDRYLDRGLDDSMWQLLLDCRMENFNLRPTARQIVERLLYLEVHEKQKRLCIAKKREKLARLLGATCASVPHYKGLLSCNDDDAQALLDTFQLLLDTDTFEDRNQLVAAIQRLSGRTERFPHRFFLGSAPAITDNPVTSGGFADVYKVDFQGEATLLQGNQVVYAKEVIAWAQLSHPNVLPFYGLARSSSRLSFVTRWATQGDLTKYLRKNPGANGILLCKDTAAGVEYLHMNDIVHGDLKGCNVLIDSSGRASLCDFGLASVTDPKIIKWTSQSTMASKGGTTRWQAPELHETEDMTDEIYNTKATDVFAWAGICYEIFTGCLPFFELPNPVVIVTRIIQGHIPTCPEADSVAWGIRGLNKRVWNLMKECWHFEPSTRPDMTQILLKLAAENVIDTRPSAEWEKDASMRFRNSQDSKESDNVNSMMFWENLESLLSRVAPGVEDISA